MFTPNAIATVIVETHLSTDGSVEALWATIKQAVNVAGENVIDRRPTTRSNGWFNEECRVAMENMHKAETNCRYYYGSQQGV